jgi:polysaccharide biosynthesis transport protein
MSFPSSDEEQSGGGFTILQILHMVLAHVWLSVGIFVLMVGLAFIAIKNLPRSYDATAALIVNSDNADPLAGRNFPIGQTGSFFPTQMELINNAVVLRPVIDRLKLQTDTRFTGGDAGDPPPLDDVILGNLRSSLRVQQGGGSQLLYISATARDPALAAEIANAVAEEYLLQTGQRTNAPAMERATRYSSQQQELKDKVSAAQSKVAEFRQKHGMADLRGGQNGDLEGTAIVDLQTQLLAAQNARRQLEARQVDASTDSSAALDAPEAATLRGKLDTLEVAMGQARATKGARHPDVLKIQSEIDATQEALKSAVHVRSDNVALQLKRARDLENKYQAELKLESSRLLTRRDLQDEGAKLLMEQRLAEESYAKALRGGDEVQFASKGNYQDVSLVSRAEPPVRASKPNKLKYFAAAMMASLALALGGPFAYELLLNRRIRCRDDLERHFRMVMLGELGPISPAPAG